MPVNIPDFKTMFAELIESPSVSSLSTQYDQSNLAIIEKLSGWCVDLGFSVEQMPLDNKNHKYNMIATLGRGEDALVLSGHTDTVPCDDHLWHSNPYSLVERDGKWYGLGTADMKSFFPLVLEVVRKLDPRKMKRPLIVLATADEESSMSGVKALVSSNRKLGSSAIIGEPTNLKPIYMHKGIMMESICVTGRSGHASNPALGHNAIEGMHEVIQALLEWRSDLQTRFYDNRFEIPHPTLNFGNIHGGDNPNRICGHCELQIDMRLLPEMQVDQVHAELLEKVKIILANSKFQWNVQSLINAVPPLSTDKNAAIVSAAERLTGSQAETVAFATEGPFLQQLGLPTIILGPGDIACAHQPDEHLDLNRIAPMQKILTQLIYEFCY